MEVRRTWCGELRLYVEYYGCPANRSDLELMISLARRHFRNLELVNNPNEADILVVHTCAVKSPTEARMLSRIKALANIGKPLIVSGCIYLISPKSVMKLVKDLSCSIITPHSIGRFPYACELALKGGISVVKEYSPISIHKSFRMNPLIEIVAISNGCKFACSFCCVRFARGALLSRPLVSILKQVREAVADGIKEVWLTSQDTASYLYRHYQLPDLVKEVANVPGDFMIRVGMMNPSSATLVLNGLVEAVSHEKVYNFIHLPLQSGSDKVLADMNRTYSVADFLELARLFREKLQCTIATDVIVGYPTESESDFNDTLAVIEEVKPDVLNISRYGHRPLTPASTLKQLDPQVVKRRVKKLLAVFRKAAMEQNAQYVGEVVEALIVEEGPRGGLIARTRSYKPIVVDAPSSALGRWCEVRVEGCAPTYLKGTVLRLK